MNYDTKMEICRRIRMLEYDGSGERQLRSDIDSSTEFTRDEKDFLYFCINRFRPNKTEKQTLSEAIGQVLPYVAATGIGYGIRVMQEKINGYVEEGKEKARENFFRKDNGTKTSS